MQTNKAVWLAVASVLLAMVTIQSGASIAKQLFPVIGPEGTTALRVGFSALMLWLVFRPWRQLPQGRGWRSVIVYGACLALVQTDIKKVIAYSSISHLGYVMLGLVSLDILGIQGAVIQMVSHGLTAAGLFFLVGMIYERCHTRDIAAYLSVPVAIEFQRTHDWPAVRDGLDRRLAAFG